MERTTAVMLRIGAWCVNPASGQISRGGEIARVEVRTMRLLVCLATRAGEVVSIEELLNEAWSGVVVSQDSVYQAVASLRRLLGDVPARVAAVGGEPASRPGQFAVVALATAPPGGGGDPRFDAGRQRRAGPQRLWRQPATVSTEGLRCLWTYPWPGNIRELQHVLEGAMVLSDGVVLPEHLPPAVQRGSKAGAAGEASPTVTGSLDEALEDWERRAILNALQKANGVQARAAKILGITERSLWYRVKKLKIQVRISGESPDRV